ncbi:MAG TPA: AI-2E family transporter [Bacteroidia bacterium]|nr:AI-2E family transporter [Bacteroidia bacterium]HNU33706.1 AI-2E family transporter [Bacteroidia bacterium]
MDKSQNPRTFYPPTQILLGIIAVGFLMYIGQEIIIPLIFGLIIAILLNPLVKKLDNKGVNRTVAILLAVTLAFLCTAGLVYFIGSQASMFAEAMPQLKQKLTTLLNDVIQWVSLNFNVSTRRINEWLLKQQNEGLSHTPEVIGQTLTTLTGVLVMIFLIPIYIFLFLFYKPLLLEFISMQFSEAKHHTVAEVLAESKTMIQSYLVGLLTQAGIVAILLSIALLILGIDYALLLGVIGALLNIIPYVGVFVATILPMLIALATKEPIYALYVFIAYTIVQFIDNNFIVPRVVASKVQVNALISVIAVLIGGTLWGVPGMFLSLPLTAIIKVICDRVKPLKPIGFLIGDTMPPIGKNFFKAKKKKV